MTNDQSQTLLAHATEACGCAVCQCGEDCACTSATDAAVCDACKEAGCGCSA